MNANTIEARVVQAMQSTGETALQRGGTRRDHRSALWNDAAALSSLRQEFAIQEADGQEAETDCLPGLDPGALLEPGDRADRLNANDDGADALNADRDEPDGINAHGDDIAPVYIHQRRKTTRALRDALARAFPAAFRPGPDAPFYNRLLQYLIAPQMLDRDTGRIVLPAVTLAVLDGVSWSGHYNAAKRLAEFAQATGLRLDISGWCHATGRARTVVPIWPQDIADALTHERSLAGTKHERVYFDTGHVAGRQRLKDETAEIEQRVQAINAAQPPLPEQERLIAYLNTAPRVNAVNHQLRAHWDEALAEAHALPESTPAEAARKHQALAVMDATFENAGLRYARNRTTARIHGFGYNITQLPRDIRKTLLKGGVTLDLVAAQAALIARIWGCPKLGAMLGDDRPFWDTLLSQSKLPALARQAVKTAIYSAAFGMSAKNIRTQLEAALHNEGLPAQDASALAKRFCAGPIIKEILAARARRIKQIKNAGGLCDAFGRTIPMRGTTVRERNKSLRTLLAVEMQSYEQHLMLSIVPVIEQERMTILCWLHDGLTIHCRDKNEEGRIVRRLQEAVATQAASLSVATRLKRE